MAERIMPTPILRGAGWLAMAAVLLVSVRRIGLREWYLVAFAASLALAVWLFHPAPASVIAKALDQGAFLMAFILLMGLLYEAAASSPSIAACGRALTRQPPGRRYSALFVGTGFMAVLFNIGVVSFLVPLIQKGIAAATPDDPLNPVRERRQLTALLRGFGWSVIWSPTAMAPLALMEVMGGVDRHRWIIIGAGIFVLMGVIGAVEDRIRFRHYRPSGKRPVEPIPRAAALRFAVAGAALLTLSVGLARLTDDTMVFGLMLACPVMVLGWLWVQARGPGGVATGTRLRGILIDTLPDSAPVAVTLAAAGFIGRAAAAMVPAGQLAAALGLSTMPDFLLLSAIPVVIATLSLLALSPIVMAVFFGSLFGSLPEMPADPTLIALSVSCGWAVSVTFSPFATPILLISPIGNLPATRLSWGWNLLFTLLAAAALVPVFAVLTGGR